MNILPKISDSEWIVMNTIWGNYPATSTKIISLLQPTEWSPKTIHTLISRLVNKGVVGVDKDKTFYEYYPLVSSTECIYEETKMFLQKVSNGSLGLFIANFLKSEKLTNEEINELKKILDANQK